MKKLFGSIVILFFSCIQVNETGPAIQPQELVGTWKTSHTYVSSCIMNGDTLAPDTGIDESTYDVLPDSIKICIKQTVKSPCGRIPLPICPPIYRQWRLMDDTLFVFSISDAAGALIDTEKYVIERLSSDRIIFSSKRSIDICRKQ